jgi:hypothetical protein
MSILIMIDDKHVPMYRIMWVSAVPHFCGSEDCQCEGDYEVRLDQGESIWASVEERDKLVEALESWQGGLGPPDGEWE